MLLFTACLVRRVGVRLVNNIWCEQSFYRRIVLFLSFSCLLFPTCVVIGILCGQTQFSVVSCWHPIKSVCWYDSCWCGSGPWFELAAHLLLPSWVSHHLLFRKGAIVSGAARRSSAPRPVPENRCVTCHILSRWTCHMPLKVVIQLSLTLWVNSSSLLHQSLNRQKECELLGELKGRFPRVSQRWVIVTLSRVCLSERLLCSYSRLCPYSRLWEVPALTLGLL